MKLLYLLFFLFSCNSVRFSPDFYKNSSQERAIVSEQGHRIYCDDPKFDKFASMHESKIKELARILKKAKMPTNELSNSKMFFELQLNEYIKNK